MNAGAVATIIYNNVEESSNGSKKLVFEFNWQIRSLDSFIQHKRKLMVTSYTSGTSQ